MTKRCNYGCDESRANRAEWSYETAGGRVRYLCQECYDHATEILKAFCLPIKETEGTSYGWRQSPRTFYVMAEVKLDNEWNEWCSLPGFALQRTMDTSYEKVARDACMVVHHERTRKVRVRVYNPATKLYDKEFVFDPVKI